MLSEVKEAKDIRLSAAAAIRFAIPTGRRWGNVSIFGGGDGGVSNSTVGFGLLGSGFSSLRVGKESALFTLGPSSFVLDETSSPFSLEVDSSLTLVVDSCFTLDEVSSFTLVDDLFFFGELGTAGLLFLCFGAVAEPVEELWECDDRSLSLCRGVGDGGLEDEVYVMDARDVLLLPRRRERLSMVLMASILDVLERDMSEL